MKSRLNILRATSLEITRTKIITTTVTNTTQGLHSILKLKLSNQENKLHHKMIFSRNLKQKYVEVGKCQNANLAPSAPLLTVSTNYRRNHTFIKIIGQNNAKTFTNICIARMVIGANSTMI